MRHYYSQNSAVRAVRTIRKGEELLDNYGYHYAVMPKEERQRKLHNQGRGSVASWFSRQ